MDRIVKITVEGIQPDTEEDTIMSEASGIYYCRNNKHYVQYEESENGNGIIKTAIRIAPGVVDIIKTGSIRSHMVFDLSEETGAVYHTPFGSLKFRIHTQKLKIHQTEDKIMVKMEYTLYERSNKLSDNHIAITLRNIV